MTNSKILPGSFLAVAVLLSGIGMASAQNTPDTAPAKMETSAHAQQHTRADFRKAHDDHGGRGERSERGGKGSRGMIGKILQKADANNDRAVTQAEVDTFRAATVANADASGEGDISISEFETIYLELTRNRMVDTFQDLDEDGDSVITQAEMDKRFGNVIERMDRNEDGQLDRQDRQARGDRNKNPHDGEPKVDHRG